jgi:DNA-binding transcriptional LysR family regulator
MFVILRMPNNHADMSFDTRLLGGLSVVNAVVAAGSFVGAGEALGLTQSGVSRAIQRLEQHLNVRLFDRSSRAVALTDEGARLYHAVLPLLDELEQAVEATGRSARAVRGKLRVNVDAHFARLILAPQIGRFLKAFPELSVEISVRDALGDPVADGFDVAVRFGLPEPSVLIARKLLELRIVTCASPKYLAQKGTPKHPRDLETAQHECILFRDPATHRPFAWKFHQGKKVITVAAKGRLIVNDGMTYLAACTAGLGVVQVFDWGLQELFATNQLVNLFPRWADEHWPLYGYSVSRHNPPAKVAAFMAFVASLIDQEWKSPQASTASVRRGST